MRYSIFDVSSSDNCPYLEDAYDIIIATNVIHATPDLNITLSNISNKLKQNGIFILNEITNIQNFATVVFGLTDGWWLYNDNYRIENSPLVTRENWQRLINNSGMSFVDTYGGIGQNVMVATKRVDTNNNEESPINSRQTIRTIISSIMLIDESEIDDDVPFQEYGIDSIISLELMKPLKDIYGYLPATLLFEYPTVRQLSDYLSKNFSNVHHQASETLDANLVKTAVINDVEAHNIKKTLKSIISKIMLIDESEIDDDVPFQEYGIDSIISLELMKPLKDIYGYLPATLLFEYPTVRQLSDYFINACIDTCNNKGVSQTDTNIKSDVYSYNKTTFKDDDIAIIGIACNFPKARCIDEFADNLEKGLDCTSDIPQDRWMLNGFLKENSPLTGGSYTTKGAFINDVYTFDNVFFNLTPNEAIRMDPQERLFLQNSFHVIQDAGYKLQDIKGTNTGVYVGVMNSSYCMLTQLEGEVLSPSSLRWSMANRVSYIFDLHGPSMAIDTACSSSLSALHLACQALKNGDCDQAIVGGINLILHPKQYEALCSLYMLSKTGICKPFGQGADGFVDGEGIGSVFVKKYKDALRDNDRIYAVIRGSYINSGGKSNGYSAPNVKAQALLIEKTLELSNLSKEDIGYIETHGTGTELGDPIEVRGLNTVFSGISRKIAIGSVKSNIGHLESAAGISGLIKVLLQMKRSVFFPSIHSDEENHHIKFSDTPFYVNKSLKSCSDYEIMNAAISSFGAGGANAHVIVSKYVNQSKKVMQDDKLYFITISAVTTTSLQMYMITLREWLMKNYVNMYSLAYTLNCARDHFKVRRIFVVKDQSELIELLKIDLDESVRYSYHELPTDIIEIINRYEAQQFVDWRILYKNRELLSIPAYEFENNYFRVNSIEYPLNQKNEIIQQHVINRKCIAPATLVIAQIFDYFQNRELCIKNLKWLKPIENYDHVRFEVKEHSDVNTVKVISNETMEVLCEAECSPINFSNDVFKDNISDYKFVCKSAIYEFFNSIGYHYGYDMQTLQFGKIGKDIAKGFLIATKDWGYAVSPALLDGGLQLAILLFDSSNDDIASNFMPVSIDECYIKPLENSDAVYCYCMPSRNSSIENNQYSLLTDFYYVNSKGEVLVKLCGVRSVRYKKNIESKKQLKVFNFE